MRNIKCQWGDVGRGRDFFLIFLEERTKAKRLKLQGHHFCLDIQMNFLSLKRMFPDSECLVPEDIQVKDSS